MFVKRNQQIHGWVNLTGLHGSITPDFSVSSGWKLTFAIDRILYPPAEHFVILGFGIANNLSNPASKIICLQVTIYALELNEIRIPVPRVFAFSFLKLPINTKLLFIGWLF